jgi:hypothetical protein
MVMMKNPGGYYPPMFPGFPGNYPGSSQIGGGYGFPGNYPGGMQMFPPQYMQPWGSYPTWNQNMPDSAVGKDGALWWKHDVKGYGVDLNRDGQYQRGVDGVLGFDKNHDGKLSKKEIEETNQKMKAFGGNYDLNGDGKVGFFERIKAKGYESQMKKLDLNHDGKFSADELDRAGAKMGVDRNQDGKFDSGETHSVYNFPTQGGWGRGSIGYTDPRNNYTQINNQTPWYPPMYGGGYGNYGGGGYGGGYSYAYAFAG